MNLLYISNNAIGTEKANVIQVLQMCYWFSRKGLKVTLAVPDNGASNHSIRKNIEKIINKNINFKILVYPKISIKGRFSLLGGYFGAWKLLRSESPDICFIRNPLFAGLSLNKGVPVIFESHNSIIHEKSTILDRVFTRTLIKQSKDPNFLKFIAISEALGNVWRERGIPEEKLLVMHDGFDPECFAEICEKKAARKKINVDIGQKTVVYAGSLYVNRGIELIIRLGQSFTEVHFIVLGGPDERRVIYEESAKQLGLKNVSFVGYLPHYKVKDFLFAADVLLMIWTRGVKTIDFCSPLKMFEYMASGRVIVGHDFPTIREVLEDGVTAYLVDPDSFEELRSKLGTALSQEQSSIMGKEARNIALAKYSWAKRAQTIVDSLFELNISRKYQQKP